MTHPDTTRLRQHGGHGTAQGAPWALLIGGGSLVVLTAVAGVSFVVGVVAVALQAVFIAYFVRHLSFAVSALRSAHLDLGAPVVDTGYRPSVCVIVSCHNEETVVDGMIASLVELDYPVEQLQLIVVDDGSQDATGRLLDEWAARTPALEVMHRPPGAGGGKSGALNAALEQARAEIVVVFDADHHPHPDVLRRLVRHFEDPEVAAVQGRCIIRNPSDSTIARLVAVDYYAGYLVNEYGRQSVFEMPAYGGANCAVRVRCLVEVGGWNTSSVTEDTDLTLRLALAGWKVRYDINALDDEEGVVTLGRYWRQRYRWARGHQQVWRDYRAAVWRSKHLKLKEKIETTMFLAAFHVPIGSAIGLIILVVWAAGLVHIFNPVDTFALWTLLFLGPLIELGAGLLIADADRSEAVTLVLFMPMFFVSAALSSKAWLDGMAGRGYSWVKTARSADMTAAE